MLLALDPGKEIGWALLTKKGQLIETGSIKPQLSRCELMAALEALPGDIEATQIAMEELIAYGTNTDSERFKVEGIIEYWAELEGKTIYPMHPGTVKKLITGRGNCKKADMRRALKSRVEIPKRSNPHIVDAVAVGLAYLIQHEDYLL